MTPHVPSASVASEIRKTHEFKAQLHTQRKEQHDTPRVKGVLKPGIKPETFRSSI